MRLLQAVLDLLADDRLAEEEANLSSSLLRQLMTAAEVRCSSVTSSAGGLAGRRP